MCSNRENIGKPYSTHRLLDLGIASHPGCIKSRILCIDDEICIVIESQSFSDEFLCGLCKKFGLDSAAGLQDVSAAAAHSVSQERCELIGIDFL